MSKSTIFALIFSALVGIPLIGQVGGYVVDTITEMVTPVQEDWSRMITHPDVCRIVRGR